MGTLRRRVSYVGLLIAVLSAGLLWSAQPVGAAGTPPNIRFFNAGAENRTGFTAPHLWLSVSVDDPDGQVPLTIQSVKVTAPDGTTTFDLTNRFRFPNLNFQGQYFADATTAFGVTTIQTGTYTVTVTDKDGNIAACGGTPGPCTDNLNPFPTLAPPNITFPSPFPPPLPPEAILDTTTPVFQWDQVPGAGSMRVQICNADQGATCGDVIYSSLSLPGTATSFPLPSGVLQPSRRYALRLEAFDTATGLLTANIRATTFRNFSVAGPNVSLFLRDQNNQPRSVFHTGDTLKLGVRFRNDGPPLQVEVEIWAGLPSGPPVELPDFDDVEIPSTPPDVTTFVNDIFTFTFGGQEPAGNYVLGIRIKEDASSGIMAQAMIAFTFSP